MLDISLDFKQKLKKPGEHLRVIAILEAESAYLCFTPARIPFDLLLSSLFDTKTAWKLGTREGLSFSGNSLIGG